MPGSTVFCASAENCIETVMPAITPRLTRPEFLRVEPMDAPGFCGAADGGGIGQSSINPIAVGARESRLNGALTPLDARHRRPRAYNVSLVDRRCSAHIYGRKHL